MSAQTKNFIDKNIHLENRIYTECIELPVFKGNENTFRGGNSARFDFASLQKKGSTLKGRNFFPFGVDSFANRKSKKLSILAEIAGNLQGVARPLKKK